MVVAALNSVQPYDWGGFLNSPHPFHGAACAPLGGIQHLRSPSLRTSDSGKSVVDRAAEMPDAPQAAHAAPWNGCGSIRKPAPVVGLDQVQRGDQSSKLYGSWPRSARASFEGRGRNGPAIWRRAELPNLDIDIQPDQRALGVVVHGSAIVRVVASRAVEGLRRHGRIFERSPGAARISSSAAASMASIRDSSLALEPAARRQDFAQVGSSDLLDPQQVALHGRVVAAIGAARK